MRRIYAVSIFILLMTLSFSCEQKNMASKKNSTESTTPRKKRPAKKPKSLGQKLFVMCQACHSVKKGHPHKTGPNLHGIFGRKAASLESFASYSEGLKNSGIIWSEEELRNWLTSPATYIPGTSMAFVGIKEKEKQDALIEYLKKVTQ